MPSGYDTWVGERGGSLSGGQRQRLAVARALLREPALLLLDEATSALDAEAEAAVNATLLRAIPGRTVVSVTHRLALAQSMDLIIVLDGGRVTEQGSHAELLARGGLYARLWHKQSGLRVSPDLTRVEVEPGRLRAIPFLSQLDESVLQEVAGQFAAETHVEDRVVVHQGDPGDTFYVVARGKLEAFWTDEAGSQRQLRVLEDGDHFGEIALIKDVPRTATVRTLTPSVLLTLRRGQFLGLLQRSPDLARRFEATVERRVEAGGALE
jgi:ATP-binding cassette subfamily B protein